MQILPKGTLYFCKNVELDPNYNYVIDFPTPTLKDEYFGSRRENLGIPSSDYSYIRNNSAIVVDAAVDDLLGVNYMYWNNDHKNYYAFVTKKEYESDGRTRVTYVLDVYQTFYDDFRIKESFIEREHQDRWTEGTLEPIFNTQNENIKYGHNYITSNKTLINDYDDLTFIYILANQPLSSDPYANQICDDYVAPTGFYTYFTAEQSKNISSQGIVAWDDGNTKPDLTNITNTLKKELLEDPRVFEVFTSNIPPWEYAKQENGAYKFIPRNYEGVSYFCEVKNVTVSYNSRNINLCQIFKRRKFGEVKVGQINKDIHPAHTNYNRSKDIKNEPKLLTYPYNFFKLKYGTNDCVVKNEYSNKANIYGFQSLSNEATSYISINDDLFKINKADDVNINQLITNQMPAFINLSTNQWKQYMMQNKSQRQAGFINTGLSAGGALIGSVASAAVLGGTLGPIGAVGSLAGGLSSLIGTGQKVLSQLAKEEDIKNQPNDPRVFNGDISLISKTTQARPILTEFEITPEYKEIVFEYLFHFGYACNTFKVPNTHSRYYFNYIKTTDVNIAGNIDKEFKEEIENIFNHGVTIWHYRNKSTFKGVNNYDYENVEVYNG